MQLRRAPEQTLLHADPTGLAYVDIELIDLHGTAFVDQDWVVSVAVDGPGVGTGALQTEEPYGCSACTTQDGRALAFIRPTGKGEISEAK